MNYWEGQVLDGNDEQQAMVTGPTCLGVIDHTLHYLMMYSQDGPHTAMVREVGEWEEVTEE